MNDYMKTLKFNFSPKITLILVAIPLLGTILTLFLEREIALFLGLITDLINDARIGLFNLPQFDMSKLAFSSITVVMNIIKKLGIFELLLLAVVIKSVFHALLGSLRARINGNLFGGSIIKGALVAVGMIINNCAESSFGHIKGDQIKVNFLGVNNQYEKFTKALVENTKGNKSLMKVST